MRSLAFAVLTLALATAPMSTTAEASAPGRVEFQLIRNGHPDGRHVVTVTHGAGGVEVASQIDINVRAGPLTLYRYQQSCRETWAGEGALASLNCTTNKNGRRTAVTARRDATQLTVTGAGVARDYPLTALPTSWWVKPPTFTGAMIDTQTGRPLNVRVVRVGRETLQIGGQAVATEHIRIIGTLSADLWYDLDGRWVGCAFTVQGQHFEYRLTSPLDSAPIGI